MQLMTREIEHALLAAPKDQPPEVTPVVVKYFCPWGSATWYVTEGERQDDGDWMLFGFADLFGDPTCAELGYTMLSELEAVRGPGGLTIERDLYLPATTLAEAMRQHGKL